MLYICIPYTKEGNDPGRGHWPHITCVLIDVHINYGSRVSRTVCVY